MASFEEEDGSTSDELLDRAQVSLDKALALEPDESEIQDMIEALEFIKSPYDEPIIKKLISRILTAEQIENDF